MKILFTGAGTGGHVYPLVAIAREIRRIYPNKPSSSAGRDLEFYYLGPKDDFSLALLSQEDFIIKTIISGKIRRYFALQNFVDILFKIPFGFVQSFFLLLINRPDLVFSKGGSGSIAVTFAAKILKIPVFIHESDVVPGLSNQATAKWAKKIFVSFPKTEYFDQEKIILTGNPIRKEVIEGDKARAVEIFNLTLSKPIILVIGGSQGAEAINDFILLILEKLLRDYEIIHVTGVANLKEESAEAQVVEDKGEDIYYHPIGYLNEEKLKHAYKAADIIVSRSGSGSIFEIAANGKPSILIPLPSAAGDHQSKNAYIYSETGAAIVFEQENLTPNFFLENVQLLFLHPERLEEMKQAALAFAKPLAARAIAREILEFLMLD
ncbi:MAG: UDP-N-acetylglucosamine--N-acetylmuramyl-(pentapeptide) pyrophosphoryl-undecaprenol N-acetylglucosamine transferase [Candidatus Staskawiczbacteria bacterium]|nr:UDP-N-acetylglucosamine--N-acetylmuramyl-(pentapeptide) pyrophosphoryl-undecaprenol N-acetylglucosamine transferase [Candidatus Staskawiczbacteria bacterium]